MQEFIGEWNKLVKYSRNEDQTNWKTGKRINLMKDSETEK